MGWYALDRCLSARTTTAGDVTPAPSSRRSDVIFNTDVIFVSALLVLAGVHFVLHAVGVKEMLHAGVLGLATGARVLVLIVFSTIVWTPNSRRKSWSDPR